MITKRVKVRYRVLCQIKSLGKKRMHLYRAISSMLLACVCVLRGGIRFCFELLWGGEQAFVSLFAHCRCVPGCCLWCLRLLPTAFRRRGHAFVSNCYYSFCLHLFVCSIRRRMRLFSSVFLFSSVVLFFAFCCCCVPREGAFFCFQLLLCPVRGRILRFSTAV